MKTYLIAASLFASAISTSNAIAADDLPISAGFEVTQWKAACIAFETPRGPVLCNDVNNGFGIVTRAWNVSEGTAIFGFGYYDAPAPASPDERGSSVVYFKTKVGGPGVYNIDEVEWSKPERPGSQIWENTALKTGGTCDLRGGYLHCVAGDPGNQFLITYRLISQAHLSCPPIRELGELDPPEEACVTTPGIP